MSQAVLSKLFGKSSTWSSSACRHPLYQSVTKVEYSENWSIFQNFLLCGKQKDGQYEILASIPFPCPGIEEMCGIPLFLNCLDEDALFSTFSVRSFVLTNGRGAHNYIFCLKLEELVLCAASSLPVFAFAQSVFSHIIELAESGNSASISRLLYGIIYCCVCPVPGICFRFKAHDDISLVCDWGLNHLHPTDASIAETLSFCTPIILLRAWHALLLERKVLVISNFIVLLTPVCELLMSIIHPFIWPHTYVPLLPTQLIDVLDAPLPYLVGADARLISSKTVDLTDVLVINLDSKFVTIPKDLDRLPPDIEGSLLHDISQVLSFSAEACFGSASLNPSESYAKLRVDQLEAIRDIFATQLLCLVCARDCFLRAFFLDSEYEASPLPNGVGPVRYSKLVPFCDVGIQTLVCGCLHLVHEGLGGVIEFRLSWVEMDRIAITVYEFADDLPVLWLPFDIIEAVTPVNIEPEGLVFELQVPSKGHVYRFCTVESSVREEWINAIEKIIQSGRSNSFATSSRPASAGSASLRAHNNNNSEDTNTSSTSVKSKNKNRSEQNEAIFGNADSRQRSLALTLTASPEINTMLELSGIDQEMVETHSLISFECRRRHAVTRKKKFSKLKHHRHLHNAPLLPANRQTPPIPSAKQQQISKILSLEELRERLLTTQALSQLRRQIRPPELESLIQDKSLLSTMASNVADGLIDFSYDANRSDEKHCRQAALLDGLEGLYSLSHAKTVDLDDLPTIVKFWQREASEYSARPNIFIQNSFVDMSSPQRCASSCTVSWGDDRPLDPTSKFASVQSPSALNSVLADGACQPSKASLFDVDRIALELDDLRCISRRLACLHTKSEIESSRKRMSARLKYLTMVTNARQKLCTSNETALQDFLTVDIDIVSDYSANEMVIDKDIKSRMLQAVYGDDHLKESSVRCTPSIASISDDGGSIDSAAKDSVTSIECEAASSEGGSREFPDVGLGISKSLKRLSRHLTPKRNCDTVESASKASSITINPIGVLILDVNDFSGLQRNISTDKSCGSVEDDCNNANAGSSCISPAVQRVTALIEAFSFLPSDSWKSVDKILEQIEEKTSLSAVPEPNQSIASPTQKKASWPYQIAKRNGDVSSLESVQRIFLEITRGLYLAKSSKIDESLKDLEISGVHDHVKVIWLLTKLKASNYREDSVANVVKYLLHSSSVGEFTGVETFRMLADCLYKEFSTRITMKTAELRIALQESNVAAEQKKKTQKASSSLFSFASQLSLQSSSPSAEVSPPETIVSMEPALYDNMAGKYSKTPVSRGVPMAFAFCRQSEEMKTCNWCDIDGSVNERALWTGPNPSALESVMDLLNRLIEIIKASAQSCTPSSVLKSSYGTFYITITTPLLQNIRQSSAFDIFELQTSQLQNIQVSELSEDGKLCFFINLFNLMSLHMLVRFGPAENGISCPDSFEGCTYCVGGMRLSLVEVECCVLRPDTSGRLSVTGKKKTKFAPTDTRKRLELLHPDRAVTFALNICSRSSPPVRIFQNSATIRSDLRISVASFLREHSSLSLEKRKIRLPDLIRSNWRDFGSSQNEVLEWLCSAMEKSMAEDLRSILAAPQENTPGIVYSPESSLGSQNSNSSDHPRVTFSNFSWENVFSFYR